MPKKFILVTHTEFGIHYTTTVINFILIKLLKEELLIEADPSKYCFINQGMLKIDNVDDAEEMKSTKKAFDTLGFTQVF